MATQEEREAYAVLAAEDEPLVQAIAAYWGAYHHAAQAFLSTMPQLLEELPKYLTEPPSVFLSVARDGVVCIHRPDGRPGELTLVHQSRASSLDEIVNEVTGIFTPPIPPGADITLVDAGLRVTEVSTGRVLNPQAAVPRIDVIARRNMNDWDVRWAPIAAKADVFHQAAGLLTGRLRPFISTTEQALHAAADELEALLDTEPNEERLHQFLVQSPHLLSPTFAVMRSKPKLGSDLIPDFAFEDAEGQWTLVEIERSAHPLFTKKGDPRAELTHAKRQIDDFFDWIERHLSYAQESFPGISQPDALIVIGRGEGATLAPLRSYTRHAGPRVQVLTWDDLVAKARRQVANLRRGGNAAE